MFIIKRGISLGNRFKPVVKIKHDFIQRQFIDNHDSGRCQKFDLALHTALVFA